MGLVVRQERKIVLSTAGVKDVCNLFDAEQSCSLAMSRVSKK